VDYPVKTTEQFAPLLKAFRRAAGLTQADLAARLGITQQTYARLEANPQVVSLARFLRVLAVLNVQMTLGTPDAPVAQPVSETDEVRNGGRNGVRNAMPAAGGEIVGPAVTQRRSRNSSKRAPTGSRPASVAKSAAKSPAQSTTKPTTKPTAKPPEKPAETPPEPVISKRERW
jgi:HTH-type transcriptional regulator/antitoxin HipB